MTTPGIRYWAGQPGRLGVGVAGTGQRAVGLDEVRVAVGLGGGVDVRRGDAQDAQLRVVLEDVREVVAVGPQLEQLADGQPRSVAERLAVHDQRVPLDPLDRHRSGALVEQLEDRVPLVVAGDAAVPAIRLDRGVERFRRRASSRPASRTLGKAARRPSHRRDQVAHRGPSAAIGHGASIRRIRGRAPGRPVSRQSATRSASSSASWSRIALAGLVVALRDRRIGVHRGSQRTRAEPEQIAADRVRPRPDSRRCGRAAAGRGLGGSRWRSLAWTLGGRHVASGRAP